MRNSRYESCPYVGLPDERYWRQSVAEKDGADVMPMPARRFTLSPADKVATAGSCFAQHISGNLENSGFNYYLAEDLPSTIPRQIARKHGYGVFSARYGNIYTPRQLLQLLDRAFGDFEPDHGPWIHDGRYFDPFRPTVEPGGFLSESHYLADRAHHLKCVRRMFETLDVFVFTLGLTECWRSRSDGAVLPVAPGCGYGQANLDLYEFYNFSASEIAADMQRFMSKLKLVNPDARVILTVSPVPLVATYEDRHVLTSTGYSKAALRVAADEIERSHSNVIYFPSYEIITGQHSRGTYYSPDLREVTAAGVGHVMRVFFHSVAPAVQDLKSDRVNGSDIDIVCDEETLVKEL